MTPNADSATDADDAATAIECTVKFDSREDVSTVVQTLREDADHIEDAADDWHHPDDNEVAALYRSLATQLDRGLSDQLADTTDPRVKQPVFEEVFEITGESPPSATETHYLLRYDAFDTLEFTPTCKVTVSDNPTAVFNALDTAADLLEPHDRLHAKARAVRRTLAATDTAHLPVQDLLLVCGVGTRLELVDIQHADGLRAVVAYNHHFTKLEDTYEDRDQNDAEYDRHLYHDIKIAERLDGAHVTLAVESPYDQRWWGR